MKKSAREKRRPILCPSCGHEIVCMHKFEKFYEKNEGFYVWYVCPRRAGETGCGCTILYEVSAKSKHPKKTLAILQPEQPSLKRKLRKLKR
ncbi:hypothetical protein ACFL1I_08660 [Candidatus Omnitrophota bacterium]